MPTTDQFSFQLDRVAAFDSGPYPVVSLYLNMQPNQHGRDDFERFLKKELTDRIRSYPSSGPERESLERDADRIRTHVANVEASANGLAIFACSAADLFEALTLAAPVEEHRLYISSQPHFYPLARLLDDYPRYAVLLADTNFARLFVVAANAVQETSTVAGTKTRRHKVGGWSQARYQRHIENYHHQHAKEVVDALSRLVAEEGLESVILAGDEVIIPLIREQLPKELSERVVDVLKLDIRAPERDVLEATSELMKARDAQTDHERVEALFDAYRSGGLGVVGPEDTARALELGQVEELLITGAPQTIEVPSDEARSSSPPSAAEAASPTTEAGSSTEAGSPSADAVLSPAERVADELLAKAHQTSARVTLIQDPALLAPVGGVGALLRFRV